MIHDLRTIEGFGLDAVDRLEVDPFLRGNGQQEQQHGNLAHLRNIPRCAPWRFAKLVYMNYYGAKDLANSFLTVRKNTIIIAEEIGEQHYDFRPTPEIRSVAQTLVHIALSPQLQEHIHGVAHLATLDGFDFFGFFGPLMAQEQAQHTKAQIASLLHESGDRFAKWLESLSDDFLGESVAMPAGMTPASKTRFEMILGVKEHEMHHRGQLMLVERIIGIVPHLTREMQARMTAIPAKA